MKENIKKFYIAENGNAFILVIFVILSMMLIAGSVMIVSFSHFEISQVYKRNSNLYYEAQSGAEKMVDNINKILLEEMPELMKIASNEAKNEVATIDSKETNYDNKISYNIDKDTLNPYEGQFLLNNLYQNKLKKKALNMINDKIGTSATDFKYKVKDEENISIIHVVLESRVELGNLVGFIVKSQAVLENSLGDILSEVNLEGDISISNLINHKEIFLEEYKWKNDMVPNTFRSPILSFGDFVVTDQAKVTIGDSVKRNGDVRVRGYIPPTKGEGDPIKSAFPELEEFGGIYVSNGGKLTVYGDVISLSSLHTIKKYNIEDNTEIHITGDVVANSVSIEDDDLYFGSSKPMGEVVEGQQITIDGDVYLDNDISIDRHAKGSMIHVQGSVFGVTNLDTSLKSEPDPNKSSGIYARGEDSKIQIDQHVFVHGSAFISFDGGKNYSELYESMGEPYEEVRFLDHYRNGIATGDGSYLKLKENYILKNKIQLNTIGHYFYAPRRISANGHLYRVGEDSIEDNSNLISSYPLLDEPEELENLFNKGGIDPAALEDISPVDYFNKGKKWERKIAIGKSSPLILDIISNSYEYLVGNQNYNYFKRNYFVNGESNYNSMDSYKGIQGYMFIKRDIFYKGIKASSGIPEVESMAFKEDILNSKKDIINQLIPVDISKPLNGWSKDTPVYILETNSSDDICIDVKSFYEDMKPVETIIIDKGEGTITLRSSDPRKNKFYGLVVSNGRIKFDHITSSYYPVEEFKGIIIARGRNKGDYNENGKEDIITINELVEGKYAGIVIKNDLNIYYDPDMLFKIRCKKRSIKRAIFDYLGLTNYGANTNNVEKVLQPSIRVEAVQKVDFSPYSVIDITNTEIHKGLRFEMKTVHKINS